MRFHVSKNSERKTWDRMLNFPLPSLPQSKVKIIGKINWQRHSKCASSLWIRYLTLRFCKTASPEEMPQLDKKDISCLRLFLTSDSTNPSALSSDPVNSPQQALRMTSILFKAVPSSGPLVHTAKNNPLIPSSQCWPKGTEDQNTTSGMTLACSVTPHQGSEMSNSSLQALAVLWGMCSLSFKQESSFRNT